MQKGGRSGVAAFTAAATKAGSKSPTSDDPGPFGYHRSISGEDGAITDAKYEPAVQQVARVRVEGPSTKAVSEARGAAAAEVAATASADADSAVLDL